MGPACSASSSLERWHQGGSESLLYCWIGPVLVFFYPLTMDFPCSNRLICSECARGPLFSVDSSIQRDAVFVVVVILITLWEIPCLCSFGVFLGLFPFPLSSGQWEPWFRHTSFVPRTLLTSQEIGGFIWAYNKAVITGLFWLWRINSKTFYLVLILSAIQWGFDWPYQNCSKACSDLVGKQMARSSNVRRHQQRVFKAGAGLSRVNLCIFFLSVGDGGLRFATQDFKQGLFRRRGRIDGSIQHRFESSTTDAHGCSELSAPVRVSVVFGNL